MGHAVMLDVRIAAAVSPEELAELSRQLTAVVESDPLMSVGEVELRRDLDAPQETVLRLPIDIHSSAIGNVYRDQLEAAASPIAQAMGFPLELHFIE